MNNNNGTNNVAQIEKNIYERIKGKLFPHHVFPNFGLCDHHLT